MKRMVVLLLALGGLGLLLLAMPAQAADGKIGLSADGRTFTPSLPALFEPDLRMIPGVAVTRSFHVRNQSTDDAYLRVNVSEASGPLVDLGEVTVTAASADATSPSVALAPGAPVLEGSILSPGQSVKIDITLALPAESTNASQALLGRLGFSVGLSQSEAVLPPVAPIGPDGDAGHGKNDGNGGAAVAGPKLDANGVLPGTGSPVSTGLILFATTVLGIGLALMRRRDQEEETVDA